MVYKCQDLAGKLCAVKVIDLEKSHLDEVRREAALMTTHNHKNVVKAMDNFIIKENKWYGIVMPLYTKFDLAIYN